MRPEQDIHLVPAPILHAMIRDLKQFQRKRSRGRQIPRIERRIGAIVKELRRRRNITR